MSIQLMPVTTPGNITPKTPLPKKATFRKVIKGKTPAAPKNPAGSAKTSVAKRTTVAPTGVMVAPGMPIVPPRVSTQGAPVNHRSNAAPVPAKGAPPLNSGRELGNTAQGQVLTKMPSRLAGQVPLAPKAVLVAAGKSQAPANPRSVPRKVTPSVVTSKSKRKPVGLPLPASVKTGAGNTTAVVPEGPTSLPAASRTPILKAPLTPPISNSVGQKAPVVSRGWQVRPASIRSQVGEIATRWKVTPPGRIRHTMEIAVSNVGNTWRVDVKAHQQDGAWLTGALTNTTPLSQSFGQHGWELSQVSLSLGQPNSSGHGGQFFGQSGHSPPDRHYGGYGSGSARTESRWTGGPEVGIDYTA